MLATKRRNSPSKHACWSFKEHLSYLLLLPPPFHPPAPFHTHPPEPCCECVQWAGSLGPRSELPAAIHLAYRSSLELYRHTIVGLTLETSSSGTQTLRTKCQFAAKLSALFPWFMEPGPPFTILSSSGGISIACAMGRYLFKGFSEVRKGEKRDFSASVEC